MLELVIMVEPKGKARPRTVTKGGRTWTYTPPASAHLESLIREAVLKEKKYFEKGIPLKLDITFYLARPKSIPKKRLFPITKPDVSNLLKCFEDAVEKYLFANDSQLTTISMRKRYDTIPKIHLVIEEDSPDETKD